MSPLAPIAVRIPRARLLRHRSPRHLLGAVPAEVRPSYRMSPREVRFARELVERHANLWLYRVHQRQFAGDFAIVDMSAPCWTQRSLFVLDLKLGAPVRLGRGPAGVQLMRAPELADSLTRAGVCRSEPILATGDGRALVPWLGGVRG